MSMNLETVFGRPGTGPIANEDNARAEAFAERILVALNGSGLLLLLSIGHRTGLLDQLAVLGPITSAELAARARMSERYVREWLAGLATAEVLVLDENGRYHLPSEYASLLTRGGAENLAVFAQYVPALGSVEDDIVRCFDEGGGVPYVRYARFHEVMAEDSGQTVLAALHAQILPLLPGIQDRLEEGIQVLDLGCGRGLAIMELAER